MIDLDDLKPLPTRYGTPQGRSKESRAIDRLGGQETIRKEVRESVDGETVIVHTRGPGTQPKITAEKEEETGTPVSPWNRTFVFNTVYSPVGVVANYGEIRTDSLPVGWAQYFVSPHRTEVNGVVDRLWNDVYRIDANPDGSSTFKINGFDPFYSQSSDVDTTITLDANYTIAAIPFYVLQNGKYRSALGNDPDRSPLFIGKHNSVVSLLPSGGYKGALTPSYVVANQAWSRSFPEVSDDGIFSFRGAALTFHESNANLVVGVIASWSKIRVGESSPFYEEIAAGVDAVATDKLGFLATVPARTSGTFTAGINAMPILYKGYTYTESGNIILAQDYGNPVWTNNKSEPLVTEKFLGAIDRDYTSTVCTGSGIALTTNYSVRGNYTRETRSGSLSIWATGLAGSGIMFDTRLPLTDQEEINGTVVYNGDAEEVAYTSSTSLTLTAAAALPKRSLVSSTSSYQLSSITRDDRECVGYESGTWAYTNTGGGFGQYMYLYYGFIPLWSYYPDAYATPRNWTAQLNDPAGRAQISEDQAVMHGSHGNNPIYQVQNYSGYSGTLSFSITTIDYIYADIQEEVFLYLETTVTHSASDSSGGDSATATLSANVVFSSRFGNKQVAVPSPGIDPLFVDMLNSYTAGGEDIARYHCHYNPLPIFAPPYVSQGNCPFISYTTKAEEMMGTPPEIHVDFNLRAYKYTTYYTGYISSVAFVPHHFLNVHERYIKYMDGLTPINYGTWDAMFSSPIRIQFSNICNKTCGPSTFSDDVSLQLSRV